jgi:N-acetylglucosaminyl-diphospho-decaprenol L-rhamnosyltransferase
VTRVAVSIVSTGESGRLVPCLTSLAEQELDGTLAVTVVANGVADGTAKVTRGIFPAAHVLVRGRQYGFAENHNAALASEEFEFGLILNPDVVLQRECIGELIDAMGRHPRAGVVVPLLSYPSGAPQPSARRFPRIGGTILRRTPLRRLMGDRLLHSAHYLAPPSADRAVDWALGACLFVRAEAWRETGGFDPGFRPLYVEDVDLAWRMWQSGWGVWQTPRARAMHEHQAATDKSFFDRRTLWHMKGMLRFVRKHPRILVSGARHGDGAHEMSR